MKWENRPVLHLGIDLGFGFCRFSLRFEEYSGFRGLLSELGGGGVWIRNRSAQNSSRGWLAVPEPVFLIPACPCG